MKKLLSTTLQISLIVFSLFFITSLASPARALTLQEFINQYLLRQPAAPVAPVQPIRAPETEGGCAGRPYSTCNNGCVWNPTRFNCNVLTEGDCQSLTQYGCSYGAAYCQGSGICSGASKSFCDEPYDSCTWIPYRCSGTYNLNPQASGTCSGTPNPPGSQSCVLPNGSSVSHGSSGRSGLYCFDCQNGTSNAVSCASDHQCRGGECIPPACTPNCSCASNTCTGQTCSNGCGGNCSGTKDCGGSCTPNCSCASNTCTGQTCSNGCGGNCSGTKDCGNPPAPTTSPQPSMSLQVYAGEYMKMMRGQAFDSRIDVNGDNAKDLRDFYALWLSKRGT